MMPLVVHKIVDGESLIWEDIERNHFEAIDRFKRSFGGYDYFHHRYIHQSKFLKLLEPLIYWALRKGYLKFGGV